MSTLIIMVGLAAMLLTLAGCGSDSLLSPSFDVDNEPQLTPVQPDREAANIAMWLSGNLTAPPDLYERVRSDLLYIRESERDLVPAVELEFREPWEPGRLVVGFDAWHYEEIVGGRYRAWDSLNAIYNIESVDLSAPSFHILKVKFSEPLNPEVLAEEYAQLPGVRFAVPNYYLGDQPMMLPSDYDQRVLYFFRDAWGDCPAGCRHDEYWVYTIWEGRLIYDGHFADTTQMPDDLQVGLAEAWDDYH